MLILKRLITAFVLSCTLFVVFFFGALIVGGAFVGGRAGANNPDVKDFQTGYRAGHEAGAQFGRQYGPVIFLGAAGLSLVSSLALSFSGVLPWCRKKRQPPKLP